MRQSDQYGKNVQVIKVRDVNVLRSKEKCEGKMDRVLLRTGE